MMKWTIKYYSDAVQSDVLGLPSGLMAKYLRLTDLMIENGANLGHPHTKYLDNGLLELRLKGKEGIARVMYCTVVKHEILMLHCFIKKTQKTPKRELNKALKRLKEVKKP